MKENGYAAMLNKDIMKNEVISMFYVLTYHDRTGKNAVLSDGMVGMFSTLKGAQEEIKDFVKRNKEKLLEDTQKENFYTIKTNKSIWTIEGVVITV